MISETEFILPPVLKFLMELWPLFMLLSTLILGGILLFLGTKFVSHKRCLEHRASIEKEQAEAQDCKVRTETLQAEVEKRLHVWEVDLEKRISNVAGEFGKFKERVENLPGANDMHKVLVGLEELRGMHGKLEATVEGHKSLMERVERQLDRVDVYLRGVPGCRP